MEERSASLMLLPVGLGLVMVSGLVAAIANLADLPAPVTAVAAGVLTVGAILAFVSGVAASRRSGEPLATAFRRGFGELWSFVVAFF